MASRFLSDVNLTGALEANGQPGTSGQILSSTVTGVTWIDAGDERATHIYENVRNDEGSTIPVGTPVYSKGEVGGSERILVGIADASDPAKMPAIGITDTELTTTGETKDGLMTLVGVYNTNISGFTGLSENDIVYVAIGGGLTITKPTGVNLIQNVGIILKTNGTIIQGLQVACIGRTNDVPTPLYVDHANQRLGIGTTSPQDVLHVTQGSDAFRGITIEGANPGLYLKDTGATSAFHIANNGNSLYFLKDSDGNGTYNSILGYWNSSDNFIFNVGNVGIGTTSPAVKLDVVGDAQLQSAAPRLVMKETGTSKDFSLKVQTDGRFSFINDNLASEVLTIEQGGNVGIGTSSPGSKLDVNGDTNITGYLDITTSSASGSPLIRFNQTTTRRGFIQMADTNDNLRVASEYGSVSLEAAATSGVDSDTSYIRINPGGTVEIGAVDGDATIATDGNMTFRIDADGNETSQKFAFQNNASTEIASLDESGNLSLDGGIELGNASDTTIARASAGKVTIEGAPIQTTQMSMSHHNFYFNTTSTTVDYFVPFNSLTESSNPGTTNYYGRMVAPYDGRIVKAVINTTAAIGTTCSAQFWVATSSGTFAPSPAETVSNINLDTANAAATATFSGTSTAEFVEGDVVGLSIQKSGTASTAYIQVTIVWEYTV